MNLEKLISLPAILFGVGMIYVGFSEVNYLYMFFYSLVGASLALVGVLLILGYDIYPTPKEKASKAKTEDIKEVSVEMKAPEQPKLQENCPNCGAPILSAGKFCGSCGMPLARMKR